MIKSLKVKGFRGFKALELRGLKPVNVIVGASAAGKTALLEAIRLALGGTPNVALQLHGHRGIFFGIQVPVTRESFETLWSSFFYDFNIRSPIELEVIDENDRQALVKMFFDVDSPVTPMFPATGAPPQAINPLTFERKSFDGQLSTLRATVVQQNGQFQFDSGPELGRSQEFFPANIASNTVQVAGWFSQASTANQERNIVSAISTEFPYISDLSVQALPGQPASLYATVKNRSHKLPVSLVSSGISKFIATITAVHQFHDGVVLIDEIENGIYFEKLRSLISALHRFSRSAKTQLFLTTHSIECLKAAASVMNEAPDDFALVQVFRENGGGGRTLVIPGSRAAAAIENDIEIRKP